MEKWIVRFFFLFFFFQKENFKYFYLDLKKSLPEDYQKIGIPTYKSVTDEFEIYKTAIANESGKFNISEIYTSDGLTMVRKQPILINEKTLISFF